ncbi:MAG: hypothetical protein WCC59_15920 [Terriglobales bacterium]
MNSRPLNWPLWSAFLLSLIAFISYPFVFVRVPITRDVPWVNLLLLGLSAALLLAGLRRSFGAGATRNSKIVGAVIASLTVIVFAFFVFAFFIFARQLPASHGAPQVGQKAPEFRLADSDEKMVSLSELLSSPIAGKTPKGVLLIFYRGYW